MSSQVIFDIFCQKALIPDMPVLEKTYPVCKTGSRDQTLKDFIPYLKLLRTLTAHLRVFPLHLKTSNSPPRHQKHAQASPHDTSSSLRQSINLAKFPATPPIAPSPRPRILKEQG